MEWFSKKEGFEMGDIISEFKIENLNRPDKKIIYPIATIILFIFGYLNYKRKKTYLLRIFQIPDAEAIIFHYI